MANKKLYDEEFEKMGGDSSKAKQINDYYDLARKQNYTKLLDSEIQLENSKEAAMKYGNNQVRAMGYGSQGMSESSMVGIQGKYANAFANLQEDYNNEDVELQKARITALEGLGEEDFQSTVQLISDSTNISRLNELLKGYGYGDIGADGNFVWGDKPEGMSQRDWAELQYRYNLQNDVIKEENASSSHTYFDRDDLDFAQYQSASGSIYYIGQHYEKELNDIYQKVSEGVFNEGSVIKVRNSEGDTIYLKYGEKGFQLVSRFDFESAEDKYSLTRKDKKNTFNKL